MTKKLRCGSENKESGRELTTFAPKLNSSLFSGGHYVHNFPPCSIESWYSQAVRSPWKREMIGSNPILSTMVIKMVIRLLTYRLFVSSSGEKGRRYPVLSSHKR